VLRGELGHRWAGRGGERADVPTKRHMTTRVSRSTILKPAAAASTGAADEKESTRRA
jgi:hypothetical protein